MICPHQTANENGTIHCAVAGNQFAGPTMRNYPCTACQAEWTDGPPTAETLTPTLRSLMGVFDPPWDESQPSRGLGDTIAKLTKRLGIKKKPGCGCGRKQAFWNRVLPYKRV